MIPAPSGRRSANCSLYVCTAVLLLIFSGTASASPSVSVRPRIPEASVRTTEKRHADDFGKARELYRRGLYESARDTWSGLRARLLRQDDPDGNPSARRMEEIDGYILLCELHLNTADVRGAVSDYCNKYPSSPLISRIRFREAVLDFDREDYTRAGELLETIPVRELPQEQQDEFLFRQGYCRMRSGQNREAATSFRQLLSRPGSTYTAPANYYLGYLYYINREFGNAIPLFEKSSADTRFSLLSRYHLLESRFMLKDYDYVTGNGPELYQELNEEYRPKTARMLSESYYALDMPDQANRYFELYTLSSGQNLSRNDYFYAGMIAYTLGAYAQAAEAFEQAASVSDSLGQNAYYHLGQSYIQLKNKHAAQEAFRYASDSPFDPAIREDAFFNYAKLSFDINRDIRPFSEYLRIYPSADKKSDEIYDYMATAFLLGKEYDQAIDALGKIRRLTPEVSRNLQKAAFFRGMQLVESSSYSKAVPYFEQAVNAGDLNPDLSRLAEYWLAECYYRQNEFSRSNEILSALQRSSRFRQSSEYPASVYSMAYNHFKQGNFDKSIELFGKYLSLVPVDEAYKQEAQTRLADSYFMKKEYAEAAEQFERIAVENNFRNLYAPLQGAVAYGLLSQEEKKIALLKEITTPAHRNSPLYSQAVYELGRTLVQTVRDEEAVKTFRLLIEHPKDSTYYYKALLEMGMIHSNLQQPDKALEYYKAIVREKPVSEEAQSALAGIENIYQARNRSEEFLAYLDEIGLSAVKTAGERENMLFNSAEQIFLGGNYTSALRALTAFTEKYPEGSKTPQAYFYIADCYDKLGKLESAADAYRKVMETGDGAFSELSTLRYGDLSYKLERYKDAIEAYETLSHIAKLDNNKLAALAGMMRASFRDKQYERAVSEADRLLEISGLNAELRREAVYDKAKSFLALGEREQAVKQLSELARAPHDAKGAESCYLLIVDAYDSGNFPEVEKRTFAFSDSKTPQSYWLARSFIVLGDSYAERDNWEQARATFESIRDNYKPVSSGDDVPELVRMRLSRLEQQTRTEPKK